MAQRRNYGFERRRKDEVRRVQQAVKQQRRLERVDAGASGPEMGEAPDTARPADTWEWFSPSRGRTVGVDAGARPAGDPPDDWILLTDVAPEGGGTTAEEGQGDPRPAPR
jgi:hypothetical protein